jgi:hypothetical protein
MISLALDSDKAGQNAAVTNGSMLQDLFLLWGIARYPREPVSQCLAVAQRTCDELAEQIQAYESLGWDTAQTEEMRLLAWDYMMSLYRKDKKTIYSTAQTAEEFETALVIEDNPIIPENGRIDYAGIKERIDLVDYISRSIELRPIAGKFRGNCPLPGHEDSTPSFWIYPDSKSWYCFGCLRGGDIFDYCKLQGVTLGRNE